MTTRTFLILLVLLIVTFIIGGCSQNQSSEQTTATDAISTQTAQPTEHKYEFKGTREEAQYFMDKNLEITLTPTQETVILAALNQRDGANKPIVSAPCCTDETAYTCCCECNSKRAIHGLAKKLIVEDNAGFLEVREAVQTWLKVINPAGYAGMKNKDESACYKGRCGGPLNSDACGGMEEDNLIFNDSKPT